MRISDWSSDVCSSDLAAREVTAIAFAAHAQRRFADQRRTDLDRLDFGVLDPLRRRFVEPGAHRRDDIAVLVDDVFERRTAADAPAQRGDRPTHLAARAHLPSAVRAAIFLEHAPNPS